MASHTKAKWQKPENRCDVIPRKGCRFQKVGSFEFNDMRLMERDRVRIEPAIRYMLCSGGHRVAEA